MALGDYPGRMIKDKERLPFGLGWEYRRRQWNQKLCPYDDERRIAEFAAGYKAYVCTNAKVDAAMLRGIDEMLAPEIMRS